MEVKISYRVPFDEIPARMQAMLLESRDKLQEATEKIIQQQINDRNVITVLKNIDDIRRSLLRVDNQLSDCYNILAGYNKALADAAIPQQEEEQNGIPVESDPA